MILTARAENFKSYGTLAYSIERSGLVAVEGQWDGAFGGRSCGAGKSAMLGDLLCWALYGETVDGKRAVCTTGFPRCEVVLELPFVSLARSQKEDGTGNKLEIAGVKHRKLADAEAYLASLVPPKKVFASTIVLGQGVGERFSGWKPAERARILSELLALSLWGNARRTLSSDARGQSDIQMRAIAQAQALGQQAESMMASAVTADFNAESARAEAFKIEEDIKYQQGEASKFRAELQQVRTEEMKKRGDLNQLTCQLKQIEGDIERLSSGSCPTCGRKWPKQVSNQRVAFQEKVVSLGSSITELERDLKSVLDRARCVQDHLTHHESQLVGAAPRLQELRILLTRAEAVEEQAVAVLARSEEAKKQAAAAEAELKLLGVLDQAFKEIPLRKIAGVLSLMNTTLAEVCRDVWDSEFFVQLTAEKQLKHGDVVPEIGLQVTSRAGTYGGSSWGQRRMIDISVQLALRQLLLGCWRNRIPLLICDDVTDVLDPYAKERLYRRLLLPESRQSAVCVLYADDGLPFRVDQKVIIGYNPVSGSSIRASECRGGCSPVLRFGSNCG